jgi:hypothetical protein
MKNLKFIPSSILSTQLLYHGQLELIYKKAVRKLKSNKVSYKKEYTFIIIILNDQQMNLKLCIDL